MAKNSKEAKPFGLFGTTMIGLGSIISSGIFIIGGLAIDRATSSILVSLAIAAFLAVLSGICFTQLESFFAKDGGVFEYTRGTVSKAWIPSRLAMGFFAAVPRCWRGRQNCKFNGNPA